MDAASTVLAGVADGLGRIDIDIDIDMCMTMCDGI